MKHEHDEHQCQDCLDLHERSFEYGRDRLKEILMELINKERDEGNIGKHEFSASICLSHVIKEMGIEEQSIK